MATPASPSTLTHCPKCGEPLYPGVTRCWAKGCDFALPAGVRIGAAQKNEHTHADAGGSSSVSSHAQTGTDSPSVSVTKSEEEAGYSVTITLLADQKRAFVGKRKKVDAELREAVLARQFDGEANALVKWKGQNGNWFQEEKKVRKLSGVASIYRPIRHRLLRGLLIGALIGVSWESCYQSWLLYERYQNIGIVVLFWVPVAFFVGFAVFENAIARFIFPAILMGIFMGKGGSMKHGLEGIVSVVVPTVGALFVSGLSGSVLGLTGGGALAGFWAIKNRGKLPIAPDAKAESVRGYSTIAALMFLIFVGSWVAYVGWTRHWPVRVESSLREDMKKEMERKEMQNK